jgi:hypothetical protein
MSRSRPPEKIFKQSRTPGVKNRYSRPLSTPWLRLRLGLSWPIVALKRSRLRLMESLTPSTRIPLQLKPGTVIRESCKSSEEKEKPTATLRSKRILMLLRSREMILRRPKMSRGQLPIPHARAPLCWRESHQRRMQTRLSQMSRLQLTLPSQLLSPKKGYKMLLTMLSFSLITAWLV